MQLGEYLKQEFILADLTATTKTGVLTELVSPLGEHDGGIDLNKARQVLLEREELGTTGIGDGVAIPHGKLDGLSKIILVVGRSRSGVAFDALDGKPCSIFFLVLAPEQAAGMHLRILAHISRLLKDEDFRRSFGAAESPADLYKLLKTV